MMIKSIPLNKVAETESIQSNKVVQAYSEHLKYEVATQFNISDKMEPLLKLMAGSLSVRVYMKYLMWGQWWLL